MKSTKVSCLLIALLASSNPLLANNTANPFSSEKQIAVNAIGTNEVAATIINTNEAIITNKDNLKDFIGKKARVVAGSYYIKISDSGKGGVVGTFAKNSEIEITGVNGEYFQAKYNDKSIEIHSKWVSIQNVKLGLPDIGYTNTEVNTTDENGNTIGSLHSDVTIRIIGENGDYWKINQDGKDVFVAKSDIQLETESLDYDSIKIEKPKAEAPKIETPKVAEKPTSSTPSVEKKADTTKPATKTASTEKKPSLTKPNKIKVSLHMHSSISSKYDDSADYTHVQGMCSDGKYFYVALLSSTNGDKSYVTQYTKILKIDINKKKVVASKKLGKIGHSNSLCYNPKTKKIYIATCTSKKPYCYEVGTDLKGLTIRKFKDKNGKTINAGYASFGYDPIKDQYVVKMNNKKLGFFDSNFKLIKSVAVSHLKINDKMTGQAISTDGNYIFSACNDLSRSPRINYILIYDMNGKHLSSSKITMKNELGAKAELEEFYVVDGQGYMLANINGFKIFKINIYQN